jgi:hypothetical protein
LDLDGRAIVDNLFPKFSAHNSKQRAYRLENPKVPHPPETSRDFAITQIRSILKIPLPDTIATLKRRAAATLAGYQ